MDYRTATWDPNDGEEDAYWYREYRCRACDHRCNVNVMRWLSGPPVKYDWSADELRRPALTPTRLADLPGQFADLLRWALRLVLIAAAVVAVLVLLVALGIVKPGVVSGNGSQSTFRKTDPTRESFTSFGIMMALI